MIFEECFGDLILFFEFLPDDFYEGWQFSIWQEFGDENRLIYRDSCTYFNFAECQKEARMMMLDDIDVELFNDVRWEI